MGEQGAPGGAWGARDEASWWAGGAGELHQEQQQLNDNVPRSTAVATQQLYTYKITGGFNSNNTDSTSNSYEYRIVSNPNNPNEQQQQWWYNAGAVNSQHSSTTVQDHQSSPNPEEGHEQNNSQEQALQQLQQQINLQQQIQNQQAIQVSQAQTIVQVQQVLQAAQSMQRQEALNQHIQSVQQQQIQEALQQQQAQNLQQQDSQEPHQQTFQVQTPKQRMPRAKPYNRPRGRMTAYAFFVQTCREEHKKLQPDVNVVFAVFSKKCAERWNTMTEKEKQRFHEMAEMDKKRYDLEMQSYVPPKDVKLPKGKRRQQFKDPNAPKRSLSAFFWFCNDERGKVKAKNPEYTMGDIAKELGRLWASTDAQTKGKYESLSEQDKARYEREMTAYKKSTLNAVPMNQMQMVGRMDEYN